MAGNYPTMIALFTKNNGEPATGLTTTDIAFTCVSRAKSGGAETTELNADTGCEESGIGRYVHPTAGSPDFDANDYFWYAYYSGATVLDSNYVHGGESIVSMMDAFSTSAKAEIEAEVDDALATMFTSSAQLVDDIWDEAMSGHLTAATFGARLQAIRSATAQGGGSNYITADASASGTDDYYNECFVLIIDGTGAGQCRRISDYTQANKRILITPNWATQPDATSVFVIIPNGVMPYTNSATLDSISNTVTSGTYGNSALKDLIDTVDGNVDAIKVVTDDLATAANVADAVWDELTSGHTTAGSTGKRLADVNEDTDTTLPATLASILTDTGEIGAAGAGLTAVPWNSDWDAEVQSEVQDAIEANALDHLAAVADSDDVVDNSIIAKLAASDGDWSGFDKATDSLEAITDNSATNPNVLLTSEITSVTDQTHIVLTSGSDEDDAYNNQTIVIYDDSNSDYPSITVITDYEGATKTCTLDSAPVFTVGADDSVRIFATPPTTTPPTAAQIRTEIDSNSTQLAAIVADSNELQTDWADGGRLDLLIDAALADTNEIQGKLPTNYLMGSSDVNDHDTDIDAILVDTNELQADWTNAGRLDTILDAIKAVTDVIPDSGALTALLASIASILADTGELQTDWVNGGRLDLLIDAIKAKTDSLTFTQAGNVDSNVQYINDIQLTGDGSGTPWGPA